MGLNVQDMVRRDPETGQFQSGEHVDHVDHYGDLEATMFRLEFESLDWAEVGLSFQHSEEWDVLTNSLDRSEVAEIIAIDTVYSFQFDESTQEGSAPGYFSGYSELSLQSDMTLSRQLMDRETFPDGFADGVGAEIFAGQTDELGVLQMMNAQTVQAWDDGAASKAGGPDGLVTQHLNTVFPGVYSRHGPLVDRFDDLWTHVDFQIGDVANESLWREFHKVTYRVHEQDSGHEIGF